MAFKTLQFLLIGARICRLGIFENDRKLLYNEEDFLREEL
jgi:hypothetical protein